MLVFAARITDEEKALRQELDGYDEYTREGALPAGTRGVVRRMKTLCPGGTFVGHWSRRIRPAGVRARGTFDYWQGWAFIAVFAAATLIPSVYLAVKNPEALRRRMQAGPGAETRPLQKLIIAVAFGSMGAMIVISALDFRFGWSTVPAAVSVVGVVLVASASPSRCW